MNRARIASIAALAVALSAGVLAAPPSGATSGQIATVAAGESHTCALLPTGTVRCWGLSSSGQIGNGTTSGFARKPQKVPSVSGAIAIAAGAAHTCALRQAGYVKCWGANYGGQLGNDTVRDAPRVVSVLGLTSVAAISASGGHTCALMKAGNVKCWGANNSGVLGTGGTTNKTKPASVVGLAGVASISTGNQDTCALLKNGTVKCWGYNGDGELGLGIRNGPDSCPFSDFVTVCSKTPVTVPGLTGVAAINVGNNATCALLKNGTVKCWGYNGEGELGNGTTAPALTPVSVSGLGGANSVTTGGRHACAEMKNAVAKCWGENIYGQLGNGTTKNSTRPTVVVFL